jgi:hypothetical protein
MKARYYPGVEALADAVRRVMLARGVTSRKVAELSAGRVSYTAVAKLANAQINNPSLFTVAAVARGLGVSAVALCAAALGENLDDDQRREHRIAALIRDYDLLSAGSRQKIDLLLDLIDMALFQARLAPVERPEDSEPSLVA